MNGLLKVAACCSIFAIHHCLACQSLGNPEVNVLSGYKGLHWEDCRFVSDKPVEELVKPPFRKRFGSGAFQQKWGLSYRIGNGHLGARIGGGIGAEEIYFNLVDLWTGKPYNDPRPDTKEHLAEIRKVLKEDKWAEAQEIAYKYFIAKKGVMKPSVAPGYIDLKLDHGKKYSDYQRVLDMDKGEVTVRYKVDGVRYDFHAICSHPDRVLCYRISASKAGALNMDVGMVGLPPHKITIENDDLVLAGTATREGGMRFNCRIRIRADGGEVKAEKNRLKVEGANSAILFLTGGTSFNGRFKDPEKEGKDEVAIASSHMKNAVSRSWDNLLKRHRKDHQSLFRRFYVELGGRHEAKPGAVQRGCENKYRPHAALTQFCRYVMIAGSREDTPTPLTLHGMWCCKNPPMWNNAYHLNENLEKNYHFAEALALPECQEPLYRQIRALSKQGAEIAKITYGLNGWCAHHQTDIWAAAGIRAMRPKYAAWPFGGAFLTQYLWRHYQYSQDRDFLKEHFPIIKGNATFCLEWLSEGKDGWLVSAPATSPENTFRVPGIKGNFEVAYATTCDMTLIRQAFKEFLWAAKELGLEKELRKRIKDTLPRLYPYPIGSRGQLLEWPQEFHPLYDRHRTAAGLYGLWSGSEFTMQHTPKLWKAAKIAKGFKGRGNKYPGSAVMWARAREGDQAVKVLREPWHPREYWMPNILGNGVAQMLLQSHAGEMDVLPALPGIWAEGRVCGIRAEGGFTLDYSWRDGKVEKLSVLSKHGNMAQVRCNGIVPEVHRGGKPVKAEKVSESVIRFETQEGQLYELKVK